MSMVSTLGKIAMGIMVAKGVGGLMNKSSSSSSGAGGGIGDLMGSLLGGNSSGTNPLQGGNIGDLLGGLLGGGAAAGGLGGLLNSLSGNTNSSSAPGGNNALGDLLSSAFSQNEQTPTPTQEEKAKIILKAMISAAKADGVLDDHEKAKITEFIGDVTQDELDFVKEELAAPLDIEALIKSVPEDMAQEVYMMSLLAINLDHQSEVEYLDKLAKGLNITPEMANAIHHKLNVPTIYS